MDKYYYKYKKYKTKYLDLSRQLGGNTEIKNNLKKPTTLEKIANAVEENPSTVERKPIPIERLIKISKSMTNIYRDIIKKKIAKILNVKEYNFLNDTENREDFFNILNVQKVIEILDSKEFNKLSEQKKIKIFKNTEINIHRILKLDIKSIKKLLKLEDKTMRDLLEKDNITIIKELLKIKNKSFFYKFLKKLKL
jgi:hypothetical protein